MTIDVKDDNVEGDIALDDIVEVELLLLANWEEVDIKVDVVEGICVAVVVEVDVEVDVDVEDT